MKPSVGRIVHYVSYGTPPGPDGLQAFESTCRAAIVTEVSSEHTSSNGTLTPKVGLCVLNPTGQFFNRDVAYHEGAPFDDEHPELACRGGTWHWPERTPE